MTSYDPRGRTPQGRAEQLAEMRAGTERAADLAHQPGSGAAPLLGRVGYWEDRVAEYEARWDRADREWRALRASLPRWPEPYEAEQVAAAQAARDRLAAECSRFRALRDACLEEFETFRREIRGGAW